MSKQLKRECLDSFILQTPFDENASEDRKIFQRKKKIEASHILNQKKQLAQKNHEQKKKQNKIDFLQRELRRLQG